MTVAVRDSHFLAPNFRRREVGQPSQVVHGPTKFWIFHLLVGLSPPREGPWLWGPSYRKSEERMSGHEVSGREQWMEARKIEEVKPPSGVGDREVRLEPVPSAPVPAAPLDPGTGGAQLSSHQDTGSAQKGDVAQSHAALGLRAGPRHRLTVWGSGRFCPRLCQGDR